MTSAARVLMTLALAALAGCSSESGSAPEPARGEPRSSVRPPAVEAVPARRERLPVRERLTGTVRAAGQVSIFSQVSGPVTDVLVENGDEVEAGQELVRIRAETSGSQLEQARASVDIAQAEAERMRAMVAELDGVFARTEVLAEEKLASIEEVETERSRRAAARAALAQAEARVAHAKATVGERREAVGQSSVRAPIDGKVGQRTVEVGMQVGPQTPLFTIGSFEQMRVSLSVPQELLPRVRVGKPVEIRAGDDGEPVLATVSRISPFLTAGSFSAQAEIDLDAPDGRLLPGMFVTVDVLYGETEPVTVIPKTALTEHAVSGVRGIYVADDVKQAGVKPAADGLSAPTPFAFVPVDIIEEGAHVVGLTGVQEGALVVVIGQHLLMRGEEDGPRLARVRISSWERVLGQQRLHREDLLLQFMAKQRRLAQEEKDAR